MKSPEIDIFHQLCSNLQLFEHFFWLEIDLFKFSFLNFGTERSQTYTFFIVKQLRELFECFWPLHKLIAGPQKLLGFLEALKFLELWEQKQLA